MVEVSVLGVFFKHEINTTLKIIDDEKQAK